MKTILSVVAISTLPVILFATSVGAETKDRTYVYCKTENLINEQTAYVCDFGETENQGCEGWQHGRIDKKDVIEVNRIYKQCSNGKWLARIEVR